MQYRRIRCPVLRDATAGIGMCALASLLVRSRLWAPSYDPLAPRAALKEAKGKPAIHTLTLGDSPQVDMLGPRPTLANFVQAWHAAGQPWDSLDEIESSGGGLASQRNQTRVPSDGSEVARACGRRLGGLGGRISTDTGDRVDLVQSKPREEPPEPQSVRILEVLFQERLKARVRAWCRRRQIASRTDQTQCPRPSRHAPAPARIRSQACYSPACGPRSPIGQRPWTGGIRPDRLDSPPRRATRNRVAVLRTAICTGRAGRLTGAGSRSRSQRRTSIAPWTNRLA